MSNLRIFFNNLWRWHLGLPEIEINDANLYGTVPDIEEIKNLQYSDQFVKLMNNRMIMGYFRYGNRHTRKTSYKQIESTKKRIELYEKTGNLEYLIDAANMLRMEFEKPQHPNTYFKAEDDSEHCIIIKKV